MDTAAVRLIDLARSQGLIRPCDLVPLGIPRVSLTRAVHRGQLERVGRGLYGLPGREVSVHRVLAEVARRVPKGVVCLLSALRFHGLTSPLRGMAGHREQGHRAEARLSAATHRPFLRRGADRRCGGACRGWCNRPRHQCRQDRG